MKSRKKKLSINDFELIKDFPVEGIFADKRFEKLKQNLKIVKENLEKQGYCVIVMDDISWRTSNCLVWRNNIATKKNVFLHGKNSKMFSYFNSSLINFDEHFKIKDDSIYRGSYNSAKFGI